MTTMYATQIGELCAERDWTRQRLIHELRQAARTQKTALPDDGNLKRMIRQWISGERGLSQMYADLFTSVFGVPLLAGKDQAEPDVAADPSDDELTARLANAAALDADLVSLFEGQTQTLRMLDRRIGAARLLAQTEAHVDQMAGILSYALPGSSRTALAAEVAEAAALAGWQALDLGNPGKSWRLHETAKAAARESGSPSVLAHVTAQQAYALLDLGHVDQAATLVRHARSVAGSAVPPLLQAWLLAAEAETLASAGNESGVRAALDSATHLLPATPFDETLPFVVLDEVHFERWRGHCLARLGAGEAVDSLTRTLARSDPSFVRATASLRCNLAMAYSVRGQHEEARTEARIADELATRTTSVRQRRIIKRLLTSGSEPSGRS